MPESSNKGGRKPRVTNESLLDVFRSTADPVLSTAEVADAVSIKRRGTLNRLHALEENGPLESKQIGGRNTVWWLVDEAAVSDTEERAPATTNALPVDEERDTPSEAVQSETVDGPLENVDFPADRDREECSAAVYAACDYLRDHGPATKRDLVAEVMPEHPLGYDIEDALEKIEADDRYRGGWWHRVVKPGLKALPDVKAPAQVASEWCEVQA